MAVDGSWGARRAELNTRGPVPLSHSGWRKLLSHSPGPRVLSTHRHSTLSPHTAQPAAPALGEGPGWTGGSGSPEQEGRLSMGGGGQGGGPASCSPHIHTPQLSLRGPHPHPQEHPVQLAGSQDSLPRLVLGAPAPWALGTPANRAGQPQTGASPGARGQDSEKDRDVYIGWTMPPGVWPWAA